VLSTLLEIFPMQCISSQLALIATVGTLLLASAPAWSVSPAGAEVCDSGTLCERLGGTAGLLVIATQLVDASVADPRTREHWRNSDLKRVKTKLSEYLCVLTGGRCSYENDDLRTIHAGQHIHSGEFYALVENLRGILDARNVGTREKNELLALLASSRRDVVEP
jgi:hemoglobin